MAQPAPVGSPKEGLTEKPTVQLVVVPPKLKGPGVGWREDGTVPPIRSSG